jgi:ParB-like chromosome segregation protein Spo0J
VFCNAPYGREVGRWVRKAWESITRNMSTRPVNKIRVGTRDRKDLGDVKALAESIEDIGLLHPITVDEENRLLSGARRLAACKLLGWKTIPVKVIKGACNGT